MEKEKDKTKQLMVELLEKLVRQKKLTISFIVRTLGVSYPKGQGLFSTLVEAGCITQEGVIDFKQVSLYYYRLTKKHYPVTFVKAIFLDVDGVLNCHSTKAMIGPYKGIDHSKVTLLKQLVEETDAQIVLISTWKEFWYKSTKLKDEQDVMANYLDKKLAIQNVYISAKTTEDDPFQRGKGIVDYINRLKQKNIFIDKFVILDDCLFDYKETRLTKHLVQTSYNGEGLTQKHIKKAKELLC